MQESSLQKTCKQEALGINFKYTVPGTPKQNGLVECKFTTLFNWLHTMLNGRKFITYLRCGPMVEAANTTILLENHLTTPKRTLAHFNIFL